MATFNVTDETFDEQVIKSSVPVVIDFWAEWCGPCKQIGPALEELSEEYGEKINLEYLEKICSAYSEFFFSYSESPLLVLNVDDVDFVSNQMDFNQIIDCVKKNIIGREFINLSPSFF